MSEKAPGQASSREDLDPLSALEESMAPFGMGDLDAEHGVILKDWSAQDFSNIYVRFRPHLISHARKFLREETQAEEVVQDAFLYLMTALPELDSELGVLRFLKWKTKMLCLDIIRSSQAGLNNNLVPLPDDVADEAQPLDSLERADDAAIIRLALAKLNPRHREVLIATTYEEKTHQEAAQQMALSDNAFRQLLHRARYAFRVALVGEAEINGKTTSEILSLASKKHWNTGRLIGGASMFLILSLVLPNFVGPRAEMLATKGPTELINAQEPEMSTAPADEKSLTDEEIAESKSGIVVETEKASVASDMGDAEAERRIEPLSSETGIAERRPDPSNTDSEFSIQRDVLRQSLDLEFANAMASTLNMGPTSQVTEAGTTVIEFGSDLVAFLGIHMDSASLVQHFSVIFKSPLGMITAVPTNSVNQVEAFDDGTYLVEYVATDLMIGDLDGSFGNVSVEDAPISRSGFVATLEIGSDGAVLTSSLEMIPRA